MTLDASSIRGQIEAQFYFVDRSCEAFESASQVIVDARSTNKRRAAVDRQFKDYYDSMSDAEQREMNGWTELGTRALASLPD